MRPTDDRKGNFIGLRINDETKADIQKLANEQGITFSECVRNIIVKHNYNSVKQNSSNVKQNEDYVKQLEQENDRLKEQLEDKNFVESDLPFDVEIELKDTLRMVELSSSKEEVPLFLKNLHDRLESGELQIENGKLKLGYSEVFEILNKAETKKWLKGVWNMCEKEGLDYKTGLRSVFEMGSKAVISGMGSQQEVNYIP